jgi:NADH-quinone oxidoreductase subunit K
MTLQVSLTHYLIASAILFSFGLFAVMARRNAIMVLMGIELILNSANINFIAFARYGGMFRFTESRTAGHLDGQMVAIFVIILAACEAAVALAIVLNIYQQFNTVNMDEVNTLKD